MYPGSATGVSLDRAVSFTGVQRYRDEKSRAYVVLYGSSGRRSEQARRFATASARICGP
jgi:hypothetical protein